jgi:hypothetical protein
MCAQCVPGYYEAFGECHACPSSAMGGAFVAVGILAFGLLGLAVYGGRLGESGVRALRQTFLHCQVIATQVSFSVPWPAYLRAAFASIGALFGDFGLDNPACVLGFKWNIYATVGLSFGGIAAGALLIVITRRCIARTLLLDTARQISLTPATSTRLRGVHGALLSLAVTATVIFYVPVSRVAVGAFRCVTTPVGYVLVSDVTITCSFSNVTYMALTCVCGIFLLLSAVAGPAWLHRHISGLAASDKLRTSAQGLLLHDIVAPYRPGWESFEIWALYRLSMVLLAAVPAGITPSLGLVQSGCGAVVAGAYAAVLWRRAPFEHNRINIGNYTLQNATNRMECASASLACICCASSIIVYAAPAAGGAISVLLIVGTVLVAAPMLRLTIHDMRCCCGHDHRVGVDTTTVNERGLFLAGDVAGAARLAAKHAEARRLRKRAVDTELDAFMTMMSGKSGTKLRTEGAGGRSDEQLIADMTALRAEQETLAKLFAPPSAQAVDAALSAQYEAALARFSTASSGMGSAAAVASSATNDVMPALIALLAAGAAIEAALAPQRDDLLDRDWVDMATHVHEVIVAAACTDAPGARSATALFNARVEDCCSQLRRALAEKQWREAARHSVTARTTLEELRRALPQAMTRAIGSRQFHAAAATALAVAAAGATVAGIADVAPEAQPLVLDPALAAQTLELGAQYSAAMVALDEPARRRAKEQLTALCDAHAAALEASAETHATARRYLAAAHAMDAIQQVGVLRENRGDKIAMGKALDTVQQAVVVRENTTVAGTTQQQHSTMYMHAMQLTA